METKAKILLLLYLFSYTPLKELVKIPVLVGHYIHHIHEHPEMSVQQFISLHYLQGIVMDEDYEQDMQLPFKVLDLNSFNIIGLFVQVHRFHPDYVTPGHHVQKIPADYSFLYQNPSLANVFHPPKV